MQLDNTRIAVQERGMLEVMDLALHVLRAYAKPLLQTALLMVVPLMILNQLLLGWLLGPVEFDVSWSWEESSRVWRYAINMGLLVLIEAPLGFVFSTAYLGQAVFLEQPRIRQLVRDMRRIAPALAWNHLVVRGVAPAWVMVGLIDRYGGYSPWEVLLILLAIVVVGLRAFRPFITEIIVLERLPMRRATPATMTIGRRSALLHNPAGSDLFARWLGSAVIGSLLVVGVLGVFLFCSGIVFNQWEMTPLLLQFCLPAAMWVAAAFMCVVRFLSYLDLRIRHEGWEVELRLRAEASRMASKLA